MIARSWPFTFMSKTKHLKQADNKIIISRELIVLVLKFIV